MVSRQKIFIIFQRSAVVPGQTQSSSLELSRILILLRISLGLSWICVKFAASFVQCQNADWPY